MQETITRKLKVRCYDEGETHIAINGEIRYRCYQCFDTGFIELWRDVDDYKEVRCPNCNSNDDDYDDQL